MQMKTDACVILALWAVGSKNFCLFGIDVMLDEIARKRREADEARKEQERRAQAAEEAGEDQSK